MMTVVNILTCIFEAMTIIMFVNTYVSKDSEKELKYLPLISTLLLALAIILSNLLASLTFANIILIGMAIFGISYLYNSKIISNIMVAIILVLIFTMTEIVTLFIITTFSGITVKVATENESYRLLGIILSKLFAFIVLKIICLKHKKNKIFSMKFSYWILLMIIFLTTTLAINLLYLLQYSNGIVQYNNLAIWCSFGLLYSMFFSLYLYEKLVIQAEEEKKYEINREKAMASEKQIKNIIDADQEWRKFKHDTINHHIVIKSLFEKHDWNGGIEYMQHLSKLPVFDEKRTDTGNPAVDSIIDCKKRRATTVGIEFIEDIQIPENLFVAPVDLCTILGNALDNCIEACEQVSTEKKKVIKLAMIYEDESITCKITNTSVELNNEELHTTKDDKYNHGFGIENIKSALANYNNAYSFKQNDDEFTFSFVIFEN